MKGTIIQLAELAPPPVPASEYSPTGRYMCRYRAKRFIRIWEARRPVVRRGIHLTFHTIAMVFCKLERLGGVLLPVIIEGADIRANYGTNQR